ncbi:MAG: sulfotransferase family 2 domain-containing protein [Arenimonas sp.]
MLISESKRFIFVHVQKTAGSSLRDLLSPHALKPDHGRLSRVLSDLSLQRDWRRRFFRTHANLRTAEARLPPEIYRDFRKIGFVRNPWERLLSWYGYVQNTPGHADCRSGEPFEDFARRFIAKPRRSQWWMIRDASGAMGLDFVGRFENLQDDTAAMCRLLDIPLTAIPHHKRLITKDYRSAYSDRLAEQVGRAWQVEIDYFGYRF